MLCFIFAFSLPTFVSAIKVSEISAEPSVVHRGNDVVLSCSSDNYYEYCIWREEDSGASCEFQWKRHILDVKKTVCDEELTKRLTFVGNYSANECAVVVSSATAGKWKCQMEEYVWGFLRGHKDEKSVEIREKTEMQIVSASTNVSVEIGGEAFVYCDADGPFYSCSWTKPDPPSYKKCELRPFQDEERRLDFSMHNCEGSLNTNSASYGVLDYQNGNRRCFICFKKFLSSDLGRWACSLKSDENDELAVTRTASIELKL